MAAYCCLLLLVSLSTVHAQGIPAEQLATLKAATVLVMVDTADEEGSGSGFLIGKDGTYGYIATNEHVISTETRAGRRVQVVFYSGVPDAETVLRADVVAEDDSRDLAILRVRSANLPEPLKLSSPQTARETQQVWVFGFPFGDMLATSKLHPSVTVTTGTITSLRLDDFGKITRVQVDADINEGNSGGPIVDATGGLVGIATEKIEDTKIGLGLPPSELEGMLQGRIKALGLHPVSNKSGEATYRAVAELVDPLRRVRSVSVFLVPQSQVNEVKPNAEGRYEQASPNMQGFSLTFNNNEYSGTVTLKNPKMTDTVYWQQVRLELANGQFRWTQPVPLTVPFSQGNPQLLPNTPGIGANNGDDWLGGTTVPQPGTKIPGNNGLLPVASDRLLLGDPQTEAGATYRVVNIAGKLTSTMLWGSGGKSVYLLEETGVLHKVSVPEFREERVLQMQQKTSYMVMTRPGLLIGLPLLQEVWLLNPDTLQILKRIPVGSMIGLAGSPLLSKAYVSDQEDALSVIDLETGKVTAQLRGSQYHLPEGQPGVRRDGEHPGFHFIGITADGQYLMSGGENINRMRIKGDELIYEEAGPGIGSNQNPQRLEISSDSRYVALPCGGGNGNAPGHPTVGPYVTFVYKITDLKTPVITIASGAYPHALSFDKAAGYIYAQSFGTPLMLFTPAGLKEKTFHFGRGGVQTEQFLPHPQGRKLLLLMGEKLLWVELQPPGQ